MLEYSFYELFHLVFYNGEDNVKFFNLPAIYRDKCHWHLENKLNSSETAYEVDNWEYHLDI